ncbi:MAG: RdgB/HAM1 family non-canonical purine NTP pyrophosphatase [Planctomycetota bacterium]|nr:RdgB/HAM1 family non-canonical purine NTP pyrophosphatase [Planctomycetota bacterium]
MARILVVGTNNTHKLDEIRPLLAGVNVVLRAAGEFGAFDPIEDGKTLDENAILKARAALNLTGEWSIADDTGLEVDALDGRPGLYAARYAGEGCTFRDNIAKLLRELDGVPEARRTARFVCVIALCRPGDEPATFRATCPGRILEAPRGGLGFGYDPVFFADDAGKALAELTLEEKNRLSHRARAVKLFRSELKNLLSQGETFER